MKKRRLSKRTKIRKYRVLLGVFLFFFFLFQLFLFIRFLIQPSPLFFYRKNDSVSHKNEVNEEKLDVPVYPKVSKVSLVMVGDALIHSSVYEDARVDGGFDFTKMLAPMKPIISSYDLAFYNQETILGGEELGLSSYPTFSSPYEVGDAFLDAGFNLVSLANNHTLDRGENAILHSNAYWKEKPVLTSGSALSWEERLEGKVFEDTTNGIPVPSSKEFYVNVYNEEQVKKDVEALRSQVDVLLVSMHFGEEYSFDVNERQRSIATYLSSLGVDIVIGHHPHVVEPVEMIGSTLVLYSLGNFLSGQRGVERLTGLIYSVDIVKTETETGSTISIENHRASLVYTYSDMTTSVRKDFQVIPYQQLNETLLPNYEMYYNQYKGIVDTGQLDIEWW